MGAKVNLNFIVRSYIKYISPIKNPQTKKAADQPGYSEQKENNLFK